MPPILMNAGAWSYGYPSLTRLLRDYKVRSLELDIVYDPEGGRYRYRAAPKLAAQLLGISPTKYDHLDIEGPKLQLGTSGRGLIVPERGVCTPLLLYVLKNKLQA
eukprot:1157775-Pelagomonas_calceolata.AAC.4